MQAYKIIERKPGANEERVIRIMESRAQAIAIAKRKAADAIIGMKPLLYSVRRIDGGGDTGGSSGQ